MRSQVARNEGAATKTRNLRRLLHAYMEEAVNNNLIGVGDRIRQARLEAGLTQDQLSDLIGVGMRQIQYYEAGESNPYRTLRRIAEATGKNIGWLLHGDPVSEPGEAESATAAALVALDSRLEGIAATVAALAKSQAEILAALQASAREERAQPRARPRRQTAAK